MPWVTLGKACSCAAEIPCPHFRDATLTIRACDRTVAYILLHDLPMASDGRVTYDVIAGRWLN